MSEEDFIISVYCWVEELYQVIVGPGRLRKRGPEPALTDSEVLAMLIVGEYLQLGTDKKIWAYFKRHYPTWFPKLGCRTSFTRQGANLVSVIHKMQALVSNKLNEHQELFLFDGFPIPLCHLKRYKRSSPFRGEGAVGYCAAKDEKYFGFKGHLLISPQGVTKALAIAPAHIDERDILPEVVEGLQGNVIADKGLIRPHLSQDLAQKGIILHTPLRKNMQDSRSKSFVSHLMNTRRKIETVIGQFVERFQMQSIRAKDTWHLLAKIGRKVLSHTVCFSLNQSVTPHAPLQLENLVSSHPS